MRQIRFLMLLGCVAIPLEARAQFPDPFPQAFDDLIRKDQIDTDKILTAEVNRTREEIAAFNREIAAARARYFNEYPNGPGFQAAASDFGRHLWNKDFRHLTYALLAAPDTVPGVLARGMMQNGTIDGGILRAARRHFDRWAEAVQKRFPVSRNPLIALSPDRFIDALAASQGEYRDYAAVRDLAEFEAAGREPGWITDTGSYITTLYFRDANMPAPVARQEYERLVSLFGEPAVHLIGERVRRVAKKDGDVADLTALNVTPRVVSYNAQDERLARAPLPKGVALTHDSSPLEVFRALLGAGDPKRFLITSIAARADTLSRANEVYTMMVAAYGEASVLRAARTVMEATMFRDGRIQDPHHPENEFGDPFSAFEVVLYRTNDPNGYARAAIAVETNTASEAAILDGVAQLAAVRGEAALIAAARDVISHLGRNTRVMSNAHRDLWQRMIPGRQARQALRELIEGKLTLGETATVTVMNPEYLAWSAFEPGARVTFTNTRRSMTSAARGIGTPRGAAAPVERARPTTQESRTLETTTASAATILRDERPASRLADVPAQVHRDELKRTFFSVILGSREPLSETTGSEQCDAAGRMLTCYWVRRVYPGLRGGQESRTVWLSDEIPGGIVRTSHEIEQNDRLQISEAQLTSVQGVRTPDALSLIQALRGVFTGSANAAAAGARAQSAAASTGAAVTSPQTRTLDRAPAARASSPTSAVTPALTAIAPGTRMVLRLLDAVGPRTRGGDVIRMALETALDINGQRVPAGAVVSFKYGIGQDRRDRRQTRTFLFPVSLAVGIHTIPIANVEPAPGSVPIEVGRGQSLTLAAGTMLTLIVR